MINKMWNSIPAFLKFFLVFLLGGLVTYFCIFGCQTKGLVRSPREKIIERFEEKIEHKSETLIEISPPEESYLGDRGIYKFPVPENK